MTKWQCLRCQHLDIDLPNEAVCTGTYNPAAIKTSVLGRDCSQYLKQKR